MFSTITGCFIRSPSFCATMRAITSLPPDAAVGTMMRIGLLGAGQFCADTGAASSALAATAIAVRKTCFMVISFDA